ncbi:MAG: glycoside hydrolase family 5 protein [Thermogutta sp.]
MKLVLSKYANLRVDSMTRILVLLPSNVFVLLSLGKRHQNVGNIPPRSRPSEFRRDLITSCALIFLVLLLMNHLPAAEVLFRWDFEPKEESPPDTTVPLMPEGWEPSQGLGIELERRPDRGWALHVSSLPGSTQHRNIRFVLPIDRVRGKRLRVSANIKAKGVSEPPNPWNGVKCMLQIVTPEETQWPQQNLPGGDFDWRRATFHAAIPDDVQRVFLILGLENVSGDAWFDDVTIEDIGVRPKPTAVTNQPMFKGHDLPRLRGAMIGPNVTDEDLLEFGQTWQANHIRWQLIWGGFPRSPADQVGVKEYRQWLETALSRLDEALLVCRKAGILVTVDLHTPPGGRNRASECRMFEIPEFQETFIQIWEEIARRYKESDVVWGYDLVNEPVEGAIPAGLRNWQELAAETARRVRAIDPRHAIIIEPAPWGSPASLDWLEPLDVPGVVYSVHMYIPHRFTHQGVHGNPTGVVYPGTIEGRYYDRETLKKVLTPVVQFQRDFNVHIYIGEFSAIRWAPGDSGCQYLRDCIEIFEENGWDWAYHAFREWDGWSVEHGPDPNDHKRMSEPTDRARLLRSWYSKNEKPTFGTVSEKDGQ